VPFASRNEIQGVIYGLSRVPLSHPTFVAHLVALLVKVCLLHTGRLRRPDMMVGHLLHIYALPTQEGVPHSLLPDIQSVNQVHDVPTHLPKVHPGGAVHHSVADTFRSSGEQLVLMSLTAVPLSVSLMCLNQPLRATWLLFGRLVIVEVMKKLY
jgi:hypothetical protein